MTAITDYIQLEYIQGATNAYINVGLNGNRNYSYEFIAVIPTDGGARETLFGCEGSANRYSWGVDSSGNYRVRYAGSSPNVSEVASPIASPVWIKVEQTVKSSGGHIYVKDPDTETQISSLSFSYGAANANYNQPMYILANNADGSAGVPSYFGVNCRLAHLKIENKVSSPNTVLRDFYPIRDTSGNVGLFDIQNNLAYWSENANFIAGPDLGGAPKLWIKSSGSWLSGTPYVKQSGSWTQGTPYIRQSGSWSQGS